MPRTSGGAPRTSSFLSFRRPQLQRQQQGHGVAAAASSPPLPPCPHPFTLRRNPPSSTGGGLDALSVVPPQRAFADSIVRGLFSAPHLPTGGTIYAAKGFGRVRVTLAAAAAVGIPSVTVVVPDGPGGARRAASWRGGGAAVAAAAASSSSSPSIQVTVVTVVTVVTAGDLVAGRAMRQCAPLVVVDDVRFVPPDVLLGSPFYTEWRPAWLLGWTATAPPAAAAKFPRAIARAVGPVVLRWAGEWAAAATVTGGVSPLSSPSPSPLSSPGCHHRVEGGLFLFDKRGAPPALTESIRKELTMATAAERDTRGGHQRQRQRQFSLPSASPSASSSKKRKRGDEEEEEEDPPSSFRAYAETETHLAVPRFWGIEKFGLPFAQNISVSAGAPMGPAAVFTGRLKTASPNQRGAVDAFLAAVKSAPTSGTLLNLYCGAGKTVTAIAAAVEHGRATVVLVSNSDLLTQWEERIGAFAPGAVVGRYQQNVDTSEGADFTVAMIQSVAARDVPAKTAGRWGLAIVDECHCIGSRVFSAAMAKIPAAHVLGLSATAYRRDGQEALLFGTVGPIRFEAVRDATEVHVRMIERIPPAPVAAAIEKIVARGGRGKKGGTAKEMGIKALALNELALGDEARTAFVVEEIAGCFSPSSPHLPPSPAAVTTAPLLPRRSILVLSNRIAQLEEIYRRLLLRFPNDGKEGTAAISVGMFTGKVPPAKRAEALETADVILATYNKAKEGLDVPRLDTLVFATPVADVVQSCGRILRVYPPGKQTPLVIDIWDRVEPIESSGHSRRRWYRSQRGYRVWRSSCDEGYPSSSSAAAVATEEDGGDSGGEEEKMCAWIGMDEEEGDKGDE